MTDNSEPRKEVNSIGTEQETLSVSSSQDATIEQAGDRVNALRNEIKKALIGQQEVINEVLIALLAAGHVLIEGVPGLGKTLMVRALAKTFSGSFARIQFTPDLMPSDVTGHVMYEAQSGKFQVRKGPVFTHLLLADEINRAPAKTQAALLEVMQEHQVTFEGNAMAVPSPYMVLATQNPLEQEGTYPLPEAQLDRFLMKIKIRYPESEDEYHLVKKVTESQIGDGFELSNVSNMVKPEDIGHLQAITTKVAVDEQVNRYAVDITRTTRNWPGIAVGAGPRGGIALIRCARAVALLDKRDFVTPDDVKSIALPTLRHRIILTPEMELEGRDTDTVLTALLKKVTAPRS